jgi:hypothetical protein
MKESKEKKVSYSYVGTTIPKKEAAAIEQTWVAGFVQCSH